ncbi:CpaE family protein [Thalassomonas sp. M1454]|uniref:AAA family ATPase n=1 Tax=Thalassomonas sp. M1454 TaxID=2594477 RepID=UPI00117CF057|nr:AAA family ATPase [Thalassomonas sp. M1454]TRX54439.1 AAA family ATPase [Thalassomonas sp. M1454]
MENKLYDVKPFNSLSKKVSSASSNQGSLDMSLSLMIKALIICDDEQVKSALEELLKAVKNLDIHFENKVSFVTENYSLAIIVFTGEEQQTILDIEKVSNSGASIILIGDTLPQGLLRKALQLSIKDVVPLETAEDELIPAIQQIANQLSQHANLAPVISVINGKGGSGASFITNSLGQVISDRSEHEIALFDADLQHGSLADSMNLKPSYYLDDALEEVKELDSTAIKSMMVRRNNLSLLPVKAYSQLNRLAHIDQNRVNQLLGKLRLSYRLMLADLSRGVDSLSVPIIESSEHVLIIIQQNIVSIREAKELVEQLKNTMGIDGEKLHIIVNRFSDKYSTISVDDIRKTIGINSVFKISNDYQLASSCTELGKPLNELSNSKHLTEELLEIIKNIMPLDIKHDSKPQGFWAKITGKK